MMSIRMIAALASPLVAWAQPAVFTFESGQWPEYCVLESGRAARPKGDTARVGKDEHGRKSGVCLTADPNRGGVFIHSPQPDTDVLGEPLAALTVSLTFRSSLVSRSPVFFERLVGGTSENTGFFRFRAQSNSGDELERWGNLRLYTKTAEGKSIAVVSTASWIQQEDVWNQVGLVFKHGRVVFYVNGERLGDEVELPLEAIPGAEGRSYYLRSAYGFVGAFDDLVVLPGKALTDEQMRNLYKQEIDGEEIKKKFKES